MVERVKSIPSSLCGDLVCHSWWTHYAREQRYCYIPISMLNEFNPDVCVSNQKNISSHREGHLQTRVEHLYMCMGIILKKKKKVTCFIMEKWIVPDFKKFWLKGLQKQKLLQTFLQVQICTFRNELKGKGVTFKQKVFLPEQFLPCLDVNSNTQGTKHFFLQLNFHRAIYIFSKMIMLSAMIMINDI